MDNDTLFNLIGDELPNIPEDVRKEWLLPSAKNNGWPPTGIYWEGVLLMQDLDFWKETIWTEEEVNLETALWSYGTRDAISKMHRGFSGDPASLFSTKKEKNRVLAPMKHLFETGTIPKKMSLLSVGGGYEIADGHHRYLGLIQAKQIADTLNKYREEGREAELAGFYKTLQDRWNLQQIASIQVIHTVWVARHSN